MASEGCKRITNSFLPCFLPKQWGNSEPSKEFIILPKTKYGVQNLPTTTYRIIKLCVLHLNMSPGTSLNWTLISAFLEFNAFPAFSIKGTPEENSVDGE